MKISESDKTETINTPFDGVLPRENAKDWHCKYQIQIDSSLREASVLDSLKDREANGWIVFEETSVGFDKNVVIIMQPPGKFIDYNFRAESTDPDTQTFMGLSRIGQKYYFPAEYDLFIDVSPYKLNEDSETQETEEGEGYFEFKVYHTLEEPTSSDDVSKVAIIHRHHGEEDENGDHIHTGIDFTQDNLSNAAEHDHDQEKENKDNSGSSEKEAEKNTEKDADKEAEKNTEKDTEKDA